MISTEHIGIKLAAYYHELSEIAKPDPITNYGHIGNALANIEEIERHDFSHRDYGLLNDHDQYFVRLARTVAYEGHFAQVDKAGLPYFLHPERVARAVKARHEGIAALPILIQVAWLHDVVEDTRFTLGDLRTLGFEEIVVKGVDAITRRDHETPEEYYARVRANHVAQPVKDADVDDNTDPERLALLDQKTHDRLIKKYTKAKQLLKGND